MIEDFWNELSEGEIHVRDTLQFELKTEFIINPHIKQNIYKQEVFLFIPSSLQINSQTYSKQQFYLDQTNLIRYKTPVMTLSEMANPDYPPSPLNCLQELLNKNESEFFFEMASDELKLFAAIFRATLRGRVHELIKSFMHLETKDQEKLKHSVTLLCSEITNICHKYRQLLDTAYSHSNQHQLTLHFKYIDEFISIAIDEFLILLLKEVRSSEQQNYYMEKQICQIILKEKLYRKKKHISLKSSKGHLPANESILYRQGLLNRFVLEALMLKYYRFSLEEKHAHLLGAAAAGIAMFVYMIVLMWNSPGFVINSFPLVALVVFLYILKDRIKEGFKNLYFKQAYRWFPDYSTEIQSPKGIKIGKLKENFAFIEPKQLPPGFLNIRNHHFNEELQALQRHEKIIQYKREMILNPARSTENRRRELTTIFRLNIHRFLQNASNAFQFNLTLDSYTQEISERLLPKVYHLNLIIRNTYLQDDLISKEEIKTFRVVVDKVGIKRVEHLKST